MNETFKFPLFVILSFFGIVGFLIQINYWIENVPVTVFVDGKEVYHGRSACVATKSLGSSSEVDIHKGFGCLFPKEYFAGKDIVIKNNEK